MFTFSMMADVVNNVLNSRKLLLLQKRKKKEPFLQRNNTRTT